MIIKFYWYTKNYIKKKFTWIFTNVTVHKVYLNSNEIVWLIES